MDLFQIQEAINNLFSSTGFSVNGMTIKCAESLSATIVKTEDCLQIRFNDNLPSVSVRKIIQLNLSILGMDLGKEGGTIILKHFPDLKFKYSDDQEMVCGAADMSDIESEISFKYQDDESQKIALQALRYANEWTTIVSQKGEVSNFNFLNRMKLRRQCEAFVIENLKKDSEIQCGSVILSYLLFTVVIPAIVGWIVRRVLDKWILNKQYN